MTIFRTVSRVYGRVAPRVEAFVAQGVDELVSSLIVSALKGWREDGFSRFDDLEINCTVRLFHYMTLARDADSAFFALRAQLEWVQPTPGMLAGTESADGMKRPDVRVGVGRKAAWTVECKRLRLSGGLPVDYVAKGVWRFVCGKYSSSEAKAAMVGYVQADDPVAIVDAVNAVISGRPDMGAGHTLASCPQPEHSLLLYRSDHARVAAPSIRIEHHWAELRAV